MTARAPLPPGGSGLPLVGGTLDLLKNGFSFVESGARRHGPIFRTKLFGRPTVVITGPDATGLFNDSHRVQRSGAMPPHVQTLFGGESLPLLDGDAHRDRKHLVMAAFTQEALAAYLPAMRRLVDDAFARWSGAGELRLLDEFKRLSIETICLTILGLPRGPVLDRVLADYPVVLRGFASLPVPLPGTAFTKAKAALGRILSEYEVLIRERQDSPKDDGLSRILLARTQTGKPITMEETRMELHHIVVAGFIEWAWFLTAIQELAKHPEVRARLEAEIRAAESKGRLDLAALGRMHELQMTSMEIRRLSPVVHVFFGKAKEAFEFNGFAVPKDWMVLWGHRSTHIDPGAYSDPEVFDPLRFAPGRAEHQRHAHAFAPNGSGPITGHKCAGWEFAPLFLQLFLVALCRDHEVAIAAPQDLSLDWSKLPPEPREGLRAVVRRRTGVSA